MAIIYKINEKLTEQLIKNTKEHAEEEGISDIETQLIVNKYSKVSKTEINKELEEKFVRVIPQKTQNSTDGNAPLKINSTPKNISENNATYELLKKRENAIKYYESQLENFYNYIYGNDKKKHLTKKRLGRIEEIYDYISEADLGNLTNLRILRKCLTEEDIFTLVECAQVEELEGTEVAYKHLAK